MRSFIILLPFATSLVAVSEADGPAKAESMLALSCDQKEFLTHEPILVSLKVGDGETLPAALGEESRLAFEIKPEVKQRKGAKPLPLEAATTKSKSRLYDLLEWYQFPAEGSFTIRAILEVKGKRRESPEIKIAIRRPDKKDPEWGPVDRLHHIPWSNYITDAFCGDTFDLVKRWPDSKLAKYCHYWNGLHHQHKKEYEKAIASFRVVTEKHPDHPLATHAKAAIADCQVSNSLRLKLSNSKGLAVIELWNEEAKGVRGVLDSQVAAWNKGDLEGFMAGYWKSDDLTFISGDKQTRGWQATLDRYRKKYQSEGKEMGKLSFKEIDIRMVGGDHALVTGRWQLEMKKESPGGFFTLLFNKKKEGWRIVHDHTS